MWRRRPRGERGGATVQLPVRGSAASYVVSVLSLSIQIIAAYDTANLIGKLTLY